jgi:hypothetical protein
MLKVNLMTIFNQETKKDKKNMLYINEEAAKPIEYYEQEYMIVHQEEVNRLGDQTMAHIRQIYGEDSTATLKEQAADLENYGYATVWISSIISVLQETGKMNTQIYQLVTAKKAEMLNDKEQGLRDIRLYFQRLSPEYLRYWLSTHRNGYPKTVQVVTDILNGE